MYYTHIPFKKQIEFKKKSYILVKMHNAFPTYDSGNVME